MKVVPYIPICCLTALDRLCRLAELLGTALKGLEPSDRSERCRLFCERLRRAIELLMLYDGPLHFKAVKCRSRAVWTGPTRWTPRSTVPTSTRRTRSARERHRGPVESQESDRPTPRTCGSRDWAVRRSAPVVARRLPAAHRRRHTGAGLPVLSVATGPRYAADRAA